MKKITLTLSVLLSLCCSLSAYDNTNKHYNDNCYKEPKKMKEEMTPLINFPGRIDVNGKYDFFVTGSFIYWQAKQDYMTLAENRRVGDDLERKTAVRMNFEYNPGFKIGLGFNINNVDWQIYSEYTRIRNKADKIANTDGNFIQYWFVTSAPSINRITGNWEFDYDMGKLIMGKPIYTSRNLIFKPYFGLKGGKIEQNLKVVFDSINAAQTEVIASTHSWLIGPMAELDFNWLFQYGFRLFFDLNASLFYQKFYKVQLDDTRGDDANFIEKHFKNNDVKRINPYAGTSLGLGWGKYFGCNDGYHFDMSLGYDISFYWNQNRIRHIISQNYNLITPISTGHDSLGDLYMHGLTFDVRFDF